MKSNAILAIAALICLANLPACASPAKGPGAATAQVSAKDGCPCATLNNEELNLVGPLLQQRGQAAMQEAQQAQAVAVGIDKVIRNLQAQIAPQVPAQPKK